MKYCFLVVILKKILISLNFRVIIVKEENGTILTLKILLSEHNFNKNKYIIVSINNKKL